MTALKKHDLGNNLDGAILLSSEERCSLLFKTLNKHGVKWCSWKSNQHLDVGIRGDTDLDILFLPEDRSHVKGIMLKSGFVEFKPAEHRGYPGVSDFISFDVQTGKVLHVHAHFLLTLGEKNAKSFIFPWNSVLLENCECSPSDKDVCVLKPCFEILFLIVRDAIKIRTRDNVKNLIKPRRYGGKDFWREFEWLKERVVVEDFEYAVNTLFGYQYYDLLLDALENPNWSNMRAIKTYVNECGYVHGWKRMGPKRTAYTMLLHEGYNKFCRVFEKLKIEQFWVIRRRVLPGEGIVIAFLGADGSGKSTVVKTLQNEWEHKIDVPRFYLGHGDGQKSFYIRIVKSFLSFARFLKKRIKGHEISKPHTSEIKPRETDRKACGYSDFLMAIANVFSKKTLLRKIHRLRQRGYVVICDRWPQNQVAGINDGPLLSSCLDSKNIIIRTIANWENKQFQYLGAFHPDLAIKLIASLDVALARKPENKAMSDVISYKIDTVKGVDISKDKNDVVVCADQPLSEVMQSVRSLIFSRILFQGGVVNGQYYECFGLPGAGKSTFTKSVVSELGYKNFHDCYHAAYSDAATRVKGFVHAAIYDFHLYVKILFFICRFGLWGGHTKNLLKIPYRRQAFKKFDLQKNIISEQLFLQDIWSCLLDCTAGNKIKPHQLSPLLCSVFKDLKTSVVYVKAHEGCVAERIKMREDGFSRFDNRATEDVVASLKHVTNMTDVLVKSACLAGVDVIELDGTALPSEVISSFKNIIGSKPCEV